ncbi:MAG: hypothetical protein ACRBM6_10800 [Geminicoccales bacterium]
MAATDTDIDTTRRALNFLSVQETQELGESGVAVADPHSTLISPTVEIGERTVIWPGVTVQCVDGKGSISIAPGAILFSGTRIVVSDGGTVEIGACAEIGEEGGFTLKAEAGVAITIGGGARLLGGGSLTSSNDIGPGAQILGPIRAQDCTLEGGETYCGSDPNRRGAVLKGCGVARTLTLAQGEVIQAFGLFAEADVRQQSFFHPPQSR